MHVHGCGSMNFGEINHNKKNLERIERYSEYRECMRVDSSDPGFHFISFDGLVQNVRELINESNDNDDIVTESGMGPSDVCVP
ncbi:hypothetical protein NPIL_413541 [Nephila pilipes]|uniref:Uncharacterized protein n=1 Tax=Nephila pilipes TaxID=299642 RepID=A0A8X6QHX0_NEPPI|nr:hypothetical protein NPIL_413541 [Nephila pilipes]